MCRGARYYGTFSGYFVWLWLRIGSRFGLVFRGWFGVFAGVCLVWLSSEPKGGGGDRPVYINGLQDGRKGGSFTRFFVSGGGVRLVGCGCRCWLLVAVVGICRVCWRLMRFVFGFVGWCDAVHLGAGRQIYIY